MEAKKINGFTVTDIIIAIMVLLIFVGTVSGFLLNAWFSNFRAQRNGKAIIYLSQQMEDVGIKNYDNVVNVTIEPEDGFIINQQVIEEVKKDSNGKGVKKVRGIITYNVGNAEYQKIMERIKIEE